MASDIFISYRRVDADYIVPGLYEYLCEQLGKDAVFMDVDSIPYGVDFREHLKHVLKDCRVVIALIGPRWGQRLRDPVDHVRDELEAALERGIPLIPVFVHGLDKVPADLLPESLLRLPYMNGTVLRGGLDHRGDRERLVGRLRLTLEGAAPVLASTPPAPPTPSASPSAERTRHALARGDVLAALSVLRAVPAERFEAGDGPDYDALVETAAALVGKIHEEWNAGRSAAERYGMEIERGARLWEAGAWMGDASLQLLRGYSLDKGLGVEQNAAQAVVLYRKAAEQGNADAQFRLGYCYHCGIGVPQDGAQAVSWYRKAAEQGNADAQCNLGVCYHYGIGVAKDGAQAVAWFRKAAEQGYAGAQDNLGVCYEHGDGVAKDATEAAVWFRKAAEQGLAAAQFNLGNSYYNGAGVSKDMTEAVAWYRKAAEQGLARAQHNLGACYHHGNGVPKDATEAVVWFRKAAEQGDESAINALNALGQPWP